jgi:hypothetical protein
LTTAARGVTRRVTVDRHYREFSDSLIVFMITQSGLTREEFYGSTRETGRKIGRRSRSTCCPQLSRSEANRRPQRRRNTSGR